MQSVIFTLCFLSSTAAREEVSEYTFETYKRDFARSYKEGDGEHELRQAIFDKRIADIIAHNSRDLSWKKGINHLTDRTAEELQQLNGYKRWMRKASTESTKSSIRNSISSSSLLQVSGDMNGTACSTHQQQCSGEQPTPCCDGLVCGSTGLCKQVQDIPESLDWSTLPSASEILSQGPCGSCWAVAASAAIQLQAVINTAHRFNEVLSPQNILSCTPNEYECGGQGGCEGATAELGFEWAKGMGSKGGLHTLKQQEYTATESAYACPVPRSRSSFLQTGRHTRLSPSESLGPAISISGWKKIEDNNAEDMLRHLVGVGPLVASIVGGDLHPYSSGVLPGCSSAVIDHAVLMMGYGNDASRDKMYWKIRNSWGKGWGEQGYFRLQRFHPRTDEPCAIDDDPSKGVACKDKPGPEGKYPDWQKVCGACGILGDTAYPIGTSVPEELLSGAGSVESMGGRHQWA